MKQPKDFAKKKAKVGKKVKRANVTKIDVKAKKIVLSTNTADPATSSAQAKFQKMLIQMRNSSENTRIEGMKAMEEYIRKGEDGMEKFMSLAIADIFEQLLNVEPKPRRAACDLLETLTRSRADQCLASTMQLIVPFLCSGMSSVHKGVRRDTLTILAMISKKFGTCIAPYLDRLLASVLAILQDASLLMSLQLSNAPVDGAALASSDTKQFKVSKKGQKKKKEETEKAQLERSKTSTFHCALSALISLLRSQVSSRPTVDTSSIPSFPCQILSFRNQTDVSVTPDARPACLPALRTRLISLFHDISAVEESLQPRYLLVALRKVVTALQLCTDLWTDPSCPSLAHFPYACSEIARHSAGSVDYALLLADAELLNLDLCDLFLGSGQGMQDGAEVATPHVGDYLLSTLCTSVQSLCASPENDAPHDRDDGVAKLRDLQATLVARILSSMSQTVDRQARLSADHAAAVLHEMDRLFSHLACRSPTHRLVLEAAVKALCAVTESVTASMSAAVCVHTALADRLATAWASLPSLLRGAGEVRHNAYLVLRCLRALRHLLLAWGGEEEDGDGEKTARGHRARCADTVCALFDASVFSSWSADVQRAVVDLLAYLPASAWTRHLAVVVDTVQRQDALDALDGVLALCALRMSADAGTAGLEETAHHVLRYALQQDGRRAQDVAVLVGRMLVTGYTRQAGTGWVQACLHRVVADTDGEDGHVHGGGEGGQAADRRAVCLMAVYTVLVANLPSEMLRGGSEAGCAPLVHSIAHHVQSVGRRLADRREAAQLEAELLLPTAGLAALFAAGLDLGASGLAALLGCLSPHVLQTRPAADAGQGVDCLYVVGVLLRGVGQAGAGGAAGAAKVREVAGRWLDDVRAQLGVRDEAHALLVACDDLWAGLLD